MPFGESLGPFGANLESLRDKYGLVIFRDKYGCRENLGVVINSFVHLVIWFIVRGFKSRWRFVRPMGLESG